MTSNNLEAIKLLKEALQYDVDIFDKDGQYRVKMAIELLQADEVQGISDYRDCRTCQQDSTLCFLLHQAKEPTKETKLSNLREKFEVWHAHDLLPNFTDLVDLIDALEEEY